VKKLLPIFVCLFSLTAIHAQDSLSYSVFWTPRHLYQNAGVKQEGVFAYFFKKGIPKDSILLQTKVYDSLGQVVRFDTYRFNRLATRYQYYYSGTVLDSMVQQEYWLKARLVHRYEYDANGNLIVSTTYNGRKKTIQERYVYNAHNQPLALYRQLEEKPEVLAMRYTYRNDRRLRQIDYYFTGTAPADNFSYLYSYADGELTSTRFFQRMSGEKRFIDCIKTYNAKWQLITQINPPLRKKEWLPPNEHPRPEEEVETFLYLPNGLLSEKQVSRNDELLWVEKHFYVYQEGY
jgi:hypothetical protein